MKISEKARKAKNKKRIAAIISFAVAICMIAGIIAGCILVPQAAASSALGWTAAPNAPAGGIGTVGIVLYSVSGVILLGALIAVVVILLKERKRRLREKEELRAQLSEATKEPSSDRTDSDDVTD